MSGTRGSGVLSSTGDVLVRGAGGVCDMCMCLAVGPVVYALNEFSPLSSFVTRCRFGDLIIHFRQPGRGGILFA